MHHAPPPPAAEGAGPLALALTSPDWIVSDDTVLHLATLEPLAAAGSSAFKRPRRVLQSIAAAYKVGMRDMQGRAPGHGTMHSMSRIAEDGGGWDALRYTEKGGGGCGAAMRAMGVGLLFSAPRHLPWLVAYAIDSSRMTHHNPLGWFGGAVAAYFTALALRDLPPTTWVAHLLVDLVPACTAHIVSTGRQVHQLDHLQREVDGWTAYAEAMGLPLTLGGCDPPPAPPARDATWWDLTETAAATRDAHYAAITPCKWPGGTGRGATLIAYDALLASGDSYARLVTTAMLHGGDNDSTGAIAGAWWGALHGLSGVPEEHTRDLEYVDRMRSVACALHEAASSVDVSSSSSSSGGGGGGAK